MVETAPGIVALMLPDLISTSRIVVGIRKFCLGNVALPPVALIDLKESDVY